jgi:hypothetical protein
MEDQVAPQEQFVTPSQAPQQGMYYSDPNGQRYNNPAEFDTAERQKYLDNIQQQAVQQQLAEQQEIAAKLSSQQINKQQVPQIPVPNFAELKKKALEDAIQQVTAKRTAPPAQPVQQLNQNVPEPNIVYLRRNLTIAELAVVFAIAIFGVLGVQAGVGFVSDVLPRIEIRDK